MLWAITASLIFALGSLFIFLYYLKKGQFNDVEDAKYQMFRDDD
jgi:cbb3-type cytochrome oxidase maturation protein